jgi:WD40 repeat protein
VLIKYPLQQGGTPKEVLLAGPQDRQSQLINHPKLKVVASVGQDKYLRLHSYDRFVNQKRRNCLINTIELSNPAKSCDFSPDGRFFVVGYEKGVFEVFQVYDNDGSYFQLECLKLFDLNRQYPVQIVKFTPDGHYLVITCNKDIVVFNA